MHDFFEFAFYESRYFEIICNCILMCLINMYAMVQTSGGEES
jgi:hypothetical protein